MANPGSLGWCSFFNGVKKKDPAEKSADFLSRKSQGSGPDGSGTFTSMLPQFCNFFLRNFLKGFQFERAGGGGQPGSGFE